MGKTEMAKNIKEIHPTNLLLFKVGAFYHAYGKDSYILSYLFNYNLKTITQANIPTCGFPKSSINKIKAFLENAKINYMLIDVRNNYDVEEKSENGKQNKYEETIEKAKSYVNGKRRIDRIVEELTMEIGTPRIC